MNKINSTIVGFSINGQLTAFRNFRKSVQNRMRGEISMPVHHFFVK